MEARIPTLFISPYLNWKYFQPDCMFYKLWLPLILCICRWYYIFISSILFYFIYSSNKETQMTIFLSNLMEILFYNMRIRITTFLRYYKFIKYRYSNSKIADIDVIRYILWDTYFYFDMIWYFNLRRKLNDN